MVRGRFSAISSQTKLHTAVVDNKEDIYCLEMIKKALKWSQSRSFTTMVVLVFLCVVVVVCCRGGRTKALGVSSVVLRCAQCARAMCALM